LIENIAYYLGEIHVKAPSQTVVAAFVRPTTPLLSAMQVGGRGILALKLSISSAETKGYLNKFVDKTIADTIRKHAENLCQPPSEDWH
jgi:hypothetical protein